jgi:membrane-bound lytic murein transglycosylase A
VLNRAAILGAAAAALAALVACTTPAEAPVASAAPPAAPSSPSPPPVAAPLDGPIDRGVARWWPVAWSELPGFEADQLLQAWPALRAGCAKPPRAWVRLCARLAAEPPVDEVGAQAFVRTHLQPFRVEDAEGRDRGLITGYYEPQLEGRRQPDARHRVPLYALPDGLRDRRDPWFARQEIDTQGAARRALRGLEIAWLADPLDALVLQIQGSGRLRITEPDGRVATVRLAFAGHNGHPYRSVGRWLIDQGELTPDSASWPAIKAWARANPSRVDEMLWANPRVVFFREEPLPDATQGPRGAMGVPLTPERSIAVDPRSIPYGSWVWLDTTEPLSETPLRRLVAAQDTGSAITGAVRADFFWGWGEQAEAQAGRMKQPLRLWVLWPRGAPPA